MSYPGGKGKTYQHVINLMPPHKVYIETHLGSGAVLRHKRLAEQNIGIDVDPRAVASWKGARSGVQLICSRAEDFLATYRFVGDELLYVDPPYHPSTRRRHRVYSADYTEADHRELLTLLTTLPCMIIVSGYGNALYDQLLAGWRTKTFTAKTHTDLRTETLWFNFEPPAILHDSRFLGDNFRQRQSTKRRIARAKEKLRCMDPAERAVIVQWLFEEFPPPEEGLPQ